MKTLDLWKVSLKCAKALDKGSGQMRVDPKWNTGDLWGKYEI